MNVVGFFQCVVNAAYSEMPINRACFAASEETGKDSIASRSTAIAE
jgi:hypothetical protein